VAPLTLASGHYLHQHGMLAPRGALYVARAGDLAAVEAFEATFGGSGVRLERLDRAAMERRMPGLRSDWTLALFEPTCADIDVGGLHQHYLAMARSSGAELRVSARLDHAEREGDSWRLAFGNAGEARAALLVDAAGAWADEVAALAGVGPLGIAPLRRTMAQLRTDPQPSADQPLVLDINGGFYFKPEHGKLWLSPHDETPSAPCDAAPEELDVAVAIDRFQQVVDWRVLAVERKWAGLRSFSPDRLPVYGFDPRVEGFFWFAGQGGFGIQTAPAAARLAAQLLLGQPRDVMTESLDAALYAPERFL
jgi:D-arginine dehydrogenase